MISAWLRTPGLNLATSLVRAQTVEDAYLAMVQVVACHKVNGLAVVGVVDNVDIASQQLRSQNSKILESC
jgi:hypothetical protein